jgi:hypothetical protein
MLHNPLTEARMTSTFFGLSFVELSSLNSNALPEELSVSRSSEEAAAAGFAPAKVLEQIKFTTNEVADSSLSVLARDGVVVMLEEAGSVVIRVTGVSSAEHKRFYHEFMTSELVVDKIMEAVGRARRSENAALVPRVAGLTLLTCVHLSDATNSQRAQSSMDFRFVLYDASIRQGSRLARCLLGAMRRLFRSKNFLIWFGVPGESIFTLNKTDEDGADTTSSSGLRFAGSVDGAYRAFLSRESALFVKKSKLTYELRRDLDIEERKLRGRSGGLTRSGFLVTSDSIDVDDIAKAMSRFLRRSTKQWQLSVAIPPVGAYQRVCVSLPGSIHSEDGAPIVHDNVTVVVALSATLVETPLLAELIELLPLFRRLQVLYLFDSGVTRATLNRVMTKCSSLSDLKAVIVDSELVDVHPLCLPAFLPPGDTDAVKERRIEKLLEICFSAF